MASLSLSLNAEAVRCTNANAYPHHQRRLLIKPLRVHYPGLCDIKDFLKAFEFARTPRHCKLPKKHEDDTPAASALASAPSSSSFGASQYLSTFIILGLVALCAIFGIRMYRSNRRLSREEMSSLLG